MNSALPVKIGPLGPKTGRFSASETMIQIDPPTKTAGVWFRWLSFLEPFRLFSGAFFAAVSFREGKFCWRTRGTSNTHDDRQTWTQQAVPQVVRIFKSIENTFMKNSYSPNQKTPETLNFIDSEDKTYPSYLNHCTLYTAMKFQWNSGKKGVILQPLHLNCCHFLFKAIDIHYLFCGGA